jgi:predicted phage-related endonuclease
VDIAGLTHSEWQEYRKHGFGASDLPVVMEQSEYKSVLALFQEKVSRRPKEELDLMVVERKQREAAEGPPPPPMFDTQELIIDPGAEFNLPAECGRALEPVIGKYLSVKMGVPVYKDTMMYQHPHYPFLLVNLDYMAICPDPATGELNRRVIVECKTVTHWKEDDVAFGPLYPHIIQCRAQMAVMNADEAIIAYLCDNNDGSFYAYRIYRDYGIESELIQRAKNLWMNHIAKEILPIPTVSSKAAWRELADYAYSDRRYELSQDLSEERLSELAQRYIAAKAAADERGSEFDDSKTTLEELQLQLVPFLLSQKEVVCGDLTLRWRQKSSRSVDYDSFKLAHPLLYAKYVTEKTNTSFEAKVRKGALQEFKEAA